MRCGAGRPKRQTGLGRTGLPRGCWQAGEADEALTVLCCGEADGERMGLQCGQAEEADGARTDEAAAAMLGCRQAAQTGR